VLRDKPQVADSRLPGVVIGSGLSGHFSFESSRIPANVFERLSSDECAAKGETGNVDLVAASIAADEGLAIVQPVYVDCAASAAKANQRCDVF
jgi:hypothetical protein